MAWKGLHKSTEGISLPCFPGSLLPPAMYSIPFTCLSTQFYLQDERDVIDLLSKCGQDYTSRDSYYYKISSRRMRAKEVGTK